MFISIEQLKASLEALKAVHQFFGITFLTCKEGRLPVGETIEFPINAEEKRLLENYYKPDPQSDYYFRVFRLSDQKKAWLSSKYASSGLQSTRTREFKDAFLHARGTDRWGWKKNYVEVLKENLSRNRPPYRNKPIPAFHLAVWLYRGLDWPKDAVPSDLVDWLFEEFSIDEAEQSQLFDPSVPRAVSRDKLFTSVPITTKTLRGITGPAPDIVPDVGTLASLEIYGVGPAPKLSFEPAQRLSLITGDNGLGKSFLLECSWWALTGEWAGPIAYPDLNSRIKTPRITFEFGSTSDLAEKTSTTVKYDFEAQQWPLPKVRPTIEGLMIYARVDGSFAIWDSARGRQMRSSEGGLRRKPFVFTRSQVWNGHEDSQGNKLINGLLSDWITWQHNSDKSQFQTLTKVLKTLSPPDLGILAPGQPTRLPHDSRYQPTIIHPYGEIPLIYASAGVRRVVTLAYLIVWAWQEHREYSELARQEPQRRMVVLIDELEAHLHPEWQRVILPALLEIRLDLARDLQCQYLVATHSPLVLASSEPSFDKKTDKLFHLDLDEGRVSLSEMPFIRHGPIDAWLTSDVFGLSQARSRAGEAAVEAAKILQEAARPDPKAVRRVTKDLEKFLAADDEFWPRWVFFAAEHGVEL